MECTGIGVMSIPARSPEMALALGRGCDQADRGPARDDAGDHQPAGLDPRGIISPRSSAVSTLMRDLIDPKTNSPTEQIAKPMPTTTYGHSVELPLRLPAWSPSLDRSLRFTDYRGSPDLRLVHAAQGPRADHHSAHPGEPAGDLRPGGDRDAAGGRNHRRGRGGRRSAG